jgi:hypothetical protein
VRCGYDTQLVVYGVLGAGARVGLGLCTTLLLCTNVRQIWCFVSHCALNEAVPPHRCAGFVAALFAMPGWQKVSLVCRAPKDSSEELSLCRCERTGWAHGDAVAELAADSRPEASTLVAVTAEPAALSRRMCDV